MVLSNVEFLPPIHVELPLCTSQIYPLEVSQLLLIHRPGSSTSASRSSVQFVLLKRNLFSTLKLQTRVLSDDLTIFLPGHLIANCSRNLETIHATYRKIGIRVAISPV